jgi:hypothetical protein
VKGLLERARKIRERLSLDREVVGEAEMSPEERQQIDQDLEKAVNESRIEVTPEDFKVDAAKKGVLFPALVNVSLVVALALGIGALIILFQRGESQIASEEGTAATAEGKLIAELKKQSEAQLEAKNREIDSIQGRLADIERQRQELQSGMDAKVKAREDELRAGIAAELEAEKKKLQTQGLSEEAITKRLADLEASKNAESTRQLDTFRRQAEEERARSEASLKALSAEYNVNLAKANEDRQKVLADSRQREEELRAQLAQSTATLETEKAKAEAALRELSAQKEKEEVASSQLVSLYAVARTDISARSYDKALLSLKAIGDYVSQGEVAQLPSIAKRREADLFVVEMLTAYVQGEREKTATDTASLVALAAQVADLKARVGEADRLAREGRKAEAERGYADALASLPDAARAQAFLAAIVREAEAVRTASLREGLAKAEGAFAQARYTEALSLWRDALAYLPETPERVAKTVDSIAAAGATETSTLGAREQSSLAAPILARAAASLEAKAYDDALPLYLEIVSKYPQATQAPQAVQGISASAKALLDRAAEEAGGRETELASQLAAVRAQLATAAAGNTDLTARLAEADRVIAAKEADAASLSAALAAERESTATLTKQLSAAEARADAAEKSLADAQASGTASSSTVTRLTQERDAAQRDLAAAKTAQAAAESRATTAERAVAAAEARAADAEKALAEAQASGASRATVANLTKQRDEAVKGLADANALLEQRDASIARLERELTAALEKANAVTGVATRDAVEAALASASPAEKVLVENLQADYAAYQARMAALDAKALAASVLEQGKALGYRNTFLASAAMQKTFPGLGEAIRKYDDWWKAEGRNQVVAIVTDLAAKPTRQERRTYLDSLLKKYSADAAMVALLKKLEPLVGTN